MPQISVDNVQIKNHGYGWFEVTVDCITDSDITTANLSGQVVIKDADGQIIDADFGITNNLLHQLTLQGKFSIWRFLLICLPFPLLQKFMCTIHGNNRWHGVPFTPRGFIRIIITQHLPEKGCPTGQLFSVRKDSKGC